MSDPSSSCRPRLILVAGMPASGKSTLAELLAEQLRIPFFTKDGIKELLFDADELTEADLDDATSERLGSQAMMVLYHNADRLLDAGLSVLLEANFRADLARRQIEPFLERADVRQVYCEIPVDEVVERFEERQQEGERHPVHAEVDDVRQLARDLERKDYNPIELDIPTIKVDTSDGFDPPIEEIVRFCEGA